MTVFTCEKCKRDFKLQSTLTRHLQRKKPCNVIHKCPICLKVFQKKSRLNRHLSRKNPCKIGEIDNPVEDTPLKPYVCGLCGTGFTHSYSKKRHQERNCPIRKMSPEEWVNCMDVLNTQLDKMSTERNQYMEQLHAEQWKNRRLSKENQELMQELGYEVDISDESSSDTSEIMESHNMIFEVDLDLDNFEREDSGQFAESDESDESDESSGIPEPATLDAIRKDV